jgi:hypothetical protein
LPWRISALILRSGLSLEQFNFKKVELLCKDLLANPCREMLVGGLCPPLSKHFKRKMI